MNVRTTPGRAKYSRNSHPMKLNEKFKFGKYKNFSLEEVISQDPSYVHWCISDVAMFEISGPAQELLADAEVTTSVVYEDDAYYDNMDEF